MKHARVGVEKGTIFLFGHTILKRSVGCSELELYAMSS